MRSGKTTIARQLVRDYGLFIVQTDHLILSMRKAFPETGIGNPDLGYNSLCEKFFPLLQALLITLESEANVNYVVEGHYIRPADVARLPKSFAPFFLGYTRITPRDKMAQIRQHASIQPCYTREMSETKLRRYTDQWIQWSRELHSECASTGNVFLDTSEGFVSAFETIGAIWKDNEPSSSNRIARKIDF